METMREILRWSHIVLGFTGLVAFWFPVFARKGGKLHKKAGKVFVFSGYGVTFSAAVSVVLVTNMIFSRGVADRNQDNLAFLAFLGYLALTTFVTLRHSMRVLEGKKDPRASATLLDQGLGISAIAASVGLIVFAFWFHTSMTMLLLALSPIGVSAGWGIVRFYRGADPSPRAWFYEHMGATLGAGIAFHTAFAVFGLRRFIDFSSGGLLSYLPWVLPAAIGIPAISLWQRHYRRKFGEETPSRSPSLRGALESK